MLPRRNARPRPRPTPRLLAFFAVDMAGLYLFAAGLVFLVRGESILGRGLPSSTAEAVVALVAGLAVMVWAAAQMLRESLRQRADARDDGQAPPR
ncbi:MAG: hypothetical protein AB1768_17640 [Pseudomonadota bacterium]|jgi:hypothetical protein